MRLDLLMERPEWFDQAACRGHRIEKFYPDVARGESSAYNAARAVCAGCPVAAECAEHGIAESEYGMWGGLVPRNERQRRDRRQRREERGERPPAAAGPLSAFCPSMERAS